MPARRQGEAIASGGAGIQTLEAIATGTVRAIQTDTACEDRDAEADGQGIESNARHRESDAGGVMPTVMLSP